MDFDVTQYLKDTENSLRDLISHLLHEKNGDNWIQKCGVTKDRIEKWKERKKKEESRQGGETVEERLIYYADFYDIKTILQKNWTDVFKQVFDDWKNTEVFLTILETYRNPDAHRRELLSHQKYLVAGISGEIRTMIIKYRSKNETGEDFFPRIESARDSLNNMCTPGKKYCRTGLILRPGDQLHYVLTASDPKGDDIEYKLSTIHGSSGDSGWQKENTFILNIKEENISKSFKVLIFIKSNRDHHADKDHDDVILFEYTVLPQKE